MIHLGDITKIDWSVVPPVDVVTGGSPCQDLSVAGKRAGLAGERSGLYMEQIRCVKELRAADEQRGRTGVAIRPRYMVWENVPGAFSSNKGKDFAAVLEEAVKIVQPQAPPIPVPEGGWSYAGCLTGGVAGRWSIAWRVHDAQFWGVPQRRRRISLVCDFGGLSAPEILFERKGLSGDFEQSGAQREEAAGGTGKGSEGASWCIQGNGIDRADTAGCNGKGWCRGVSYTLNTIDRPAVAYSFDSLASNSMKSRNPNSGCREVDVAKTLDATRPDPSKNQGGIAIVCHTDSSEPIPINDKATRYRGGGSTRHGDGAGNGLGVGHPGDPSPTLSTCDRHAVAVHLLQDPVTSIEKTPCLSSGNSDHGQAMCGVMCAGFSMGQSAKARSIGYQEERAPTIRGGEGGNQKPCVMCLNDQGGSVVVRRLTPLECERLQGYPDGWTDIGEWVDSKGKKHKPADSPRYKALGNSIALPFWCWLLRRISAQYYRPATLGSLFDGIGGFPLCWERCNGKGTALWASEIEEFPMAVTKIRFGEER